MQRATTAVAAVCTMTAVLTATGCSLTTTQRSTTIAQLKSVSATLDECRQQGLFDRNALSCLIADARRKGIPEESLKYVNEDSYGSKLVLETGTVCAGVAYCGPYSKGPNRQDDCGKGDDVVLKTCR